MVKYETATLRIKDLGRRGTALLLGDFLVRRGQAVPESGSMAIGDSLTIRTSPYIFRVALAQLLHPFTLAGSGRGMTSDRCG